MDTILLRSDGRWQSESFFSPEKVDTMKTQVEAKRICIYQTPTKSLFNVAEIVRFLTLFFGS